LIEIAETNSTRLIRLVNDLLDFERMIQGKYTLNLAFADLKAVIANAIATLEPYGEGLGVRFDASGVEMTGTIECDEERIAQVLLNLLSNAAKFSPSGSIVHVKARLLPAAVRVEVVDHGCGIPAAFTDRIFEKFAQANRSDSRKQGSGLGLSIAKMIVEAHHGTIGFKSDEGQGSLFWFELPSRQQSP
jgi:signal transduction histidine kinase